jgi:hypothetical protein
MGLTEREQAILDFEQRWWLLPGPKEASIKENLSVSATHYYHLLGRLLDSPEAMRYDPLVVRRLRRLRQYRRRVRFEGRPTGGQESR